MPLLRRKRWAAAAPPPPESVPAGARVWMVRFTGEVHTDYDGYAAALNAYRERKWACRLSGRSGMTFEEAATSEDAASRATRAAVPRALEPTIVSAANFATGSVDAVADAALKRLRATFCVGEEVTVMYEGGAYRCHVVGMAEEDKSVRVAWLVADAPLDEEFDAVAAGKIERAEAAKAAREAPGGSEADGAGGEAGGPAAGGGSATAALDKGGGFPSSSTRAEGGDADAPVALDDGELDESEMGPYVTVTTEPRSAVSRQLPLPQKAFVKAWLREHSEPYRGFKGAPLVMDGPLRARFNLPERPPDSLLGNILELERQEQAREAKRQAAAAKQAEAAARRELKRRREAEDEERRVTARIAKMSEKALSAAAAKLAKQESKAAAKAASAEAKELARERKIAKREEAELAKRLAAEEKARRKAAAAAEAARLREEAQLREQAEKAERARQREAERQERLRQKEMEKEAARLERERQKVERDRQKEEARLQREKEKAEARRLAEQEKEAAREAAEKEKLYPMEDTLVGKGTEHWAEGDPDRATRPVPGPYLPFCAPLLPLETQHAMAGHALSLTALFRHYSQELHVSHFSVEMLVAALQRESSCGDGGLIGEMHAALMWNLCSYSDEHINAVAAVGIERITVENSIGMALAAFVRDILPEDAIIGDSFTTKQALADAIDDGSYASASAYTKLMILCALADDALTTGALHDRVEDDADSLLALRNERVTVEAEARRRLEHALSESRKKWEQRSGEVKRKAQEEALERRAAEAAKLVASRGAGAPAAGSGGPISPQFELPPPPDETEVGSMGAQATLGASATEEDLMATAFDNVDTMGIGLVDGIASAAAQGPKPPASTGDTKSRATGAQALRPVGEKAWRWNQVALKEVRRLAAEQQAEARQINDAEAAAKERRALKFARACEQHYVREVPLGEDHLRNRYWWFQGDGRVFVEQCSGCVGAPPSSSAGPTWAVLRGGAQLNALAASLNPKGVRERRLRETLTLRGGDIQAALDGMVQPQHAAAKLNRWKNHLRTGNEW